MLIEMRRQSLFWMLESTQTFVVNFFKFVSLLKMGIGFNVACMRLAPSFANFCLHFPQIYPVIQIKQTRVNVIPMQNVYVTIPFYPVSCGNRDNWNLFNVVP